MQMPGRDFSTGILVFILYIYAFWTVDVNDVSNEQFKGMLDPRISQ